MPSLLIWFDSIFQCFPLLYILQRKLDWGSMIRIRTITIPFLHRCTQFNFWIKFQILHFSLHCHLKGHLLLKGAEGHIWRHICVHFLHCLLKTINIFIQLFKIEILQSIGNKYNKPTRGRWWAEWYYIHVYSFLEYWWTIVEIFSRSLRAEFDLWERESNWGCWSGGQESELDAATGHLSLTHPTT